MGGCNRRVRIGRGRNVLCAALGLVALQSHARAQDPSSRSEASEVAPNEEVVAPRLLGAVSVEYPPGAEGEATVDLKLLIRETGEVGDVLVTEGAEPFATQAKNAARTWTFSPAKVGGEARAAWILFRVEFEPPVLVDEVPAEPSASSEATRLTNDAPTFESSPGSIEEFEVSVQGVRRPGVGRVMSDEETQIIPGAEGDPIRAIEAMPGTVPVLASGPFIGVRGSSPGMVGYEFDGISLPYLFHLARGPAVVHPWLVDSATIHGTGGPARLGRAGGGFIEATAAEPAGRLRASARVRLTDAALGAEAPFADGKGSVLLAGRYSYTKALVSLIAPEFSLDFWDYQGRVRYALGESDGIEILALGAGDRSAVEEEGQPIDELFNGQFHRASLRYTHRNSSGGFHRVSATYGHDRWDSTSSLIRPSDNTGTVRLDAGQPVSDSLWLDYGADFTLRFQADDFTSGPDMAERYYRTDVMAAAWLDSTWQVTSRTTMSLGLRVDVYSSGESPIDAAATAAAAQPRFALSHRLNDWARWHTSVGVSAQPWSDTQRPPGRMNAIDGGLEHTILTDGGMEFALPADFTFDTTLFHNVYFNVGDISEIRFIENQLYQIERGQGQSFGMELSLRRTFARHLRGFLSYTLSQSWRSLGRVQTFAQFDRPHVIDLALAYDFGRGWSLSSRGTYYSGFQAHMSRVEDIPAAPRSTPYYQVDWQVAKRWKINQEGAWWGFSVGVLNTTLNSEVTNFYCRPDLTCEEDLVGPATIPTIGVEGEL